MGGSTPALIPDRLCVLDRMCRDDLVDLGLPDHRLVTTHNPALDDLVKEARLATGEPGWASPTGPD